MTLPSVTLLDKSMDAKTEHLVDELLVISRRLARIASEIEDSASTAEQWTAHNLAHDASRYAWSVRVWLFKHDEKYGTVEPSDSPSKY